MTRTENKIMPDFWDAYGQFLGESLSCDGELSLSVINKKRKSLVTKLQKELNKDVSEYDANQWWADVNTLFFLDIAKQCIILLEEEK